MPAVRRSRSAVAAATVGLFIAAGFQITWYVVVERPTCTSTGVFACAGPALLMYAVGLPVTYFVWALGLKLVRAPLPWLAPVVVFLGVVALTPLLDDAPVWMWPLLFAAACLVWTRLLGPAANTDERR